VGEVNSENRSVVLTEGREIVESFRGDCFAWDDCFGVVLLKKSSNKSICVFVVVRGRGRG